MASKENQWNKPSINKEDDDAFLYAMLLSTSHIFPMALNAAIELNVFDIIASRANGDGYMSPSEIASQLPTKNPDAPSLLDRMLRLLASHSLLTSSIRTCEDGRVERLYGLSPAAKFYVQNEDGGYLGSLKLINFPRKAAEVWYVYIYATIEHGIGVEVISILTCFTYFLESQPYHLATYSRSFFSVSLKIKWLLRSQLVRNSILINHKPNCNFKSHIILKGTQEKRKRDF
jgi:hypothetical protein